MVLSLVRQPARQRRREDVEEAHRVLHGQRAPRVLRAEHTAGENGLRREERGADIVVGRRQTRLRRHDAPIAGRDRRRALTTSKHAISRRASRFPNVKIRSPSFTNARTLPATFPFPATPP